MNTTKPMVATVMLPSGESAKIESPNAVVVGKFVAHGKTIENPTLFVPFLRLTGAMEEGTADREQWDHTWGGTAAKLSEACSTGNDARCRVYEVISNGLVNGEIPFARFTNMSDGRWWGKFYDASVDTVTVRPSPTDKLTSWINNRSSMAAKVVTPSTFQGFGDIGGWISDTISDIGSAIVDFADAAWEILEDGVEAAWEFLKDVLVMLMDICEQLKKYLPPEEKKEVAMVALTVVAPGVGTSVAGAIALAEKICGAIAVIVFATQGPLPPPPLSQRGRQDAEDEDKFSKIVASALVLTGAAGAGLPAPTSYPSGSFSVYNPHTKQYHVLVIP